MEQTPIICDTNIWYYISDGRIPSENLNAIPLYGTFISGYEFCSSPNAMRDYPQLRAAIIAMLRYAQGFCIRDPLEHIKHISGYPSSNSKWREISQLLRAAEETVEPNPAFDEIARYAYQVHTEQVRQDNQLFLDIIETHRSRIECRGLHKKNMTKEEVRVEHLEITKQVISTTVGGISVNWDDLELYLLIFNEWMRQLSIQPSLKIKPNDWDDLSNLVYVKPGSLYWTKDYRKTREFILLCNCGHYLYEPA